MGREARRKREGRRVRDRRARFEALRALPAFVVKIQRSITTTLSAPQWLFYDQTRTVWIQLAESEVDLSVRALIGVDLRGFAWANITPNGALNILERRGRAPEQGW